MASPFPWQSGCRGGIQSYARALGQGNQAAPNPKTIYLEKALSFFYGGNVKNPSIFGRYRRTNIAAWQNMTDYGYNYSFAPPLIGIPSTNDPSHTCRIAPSYDGNVSNSVVLEDVLNQMVGSDVKHGSMKELIDAGVFDSMVGVDSSSVFYSYRDLLMVHGGDPYATNVDMSDLTGELFQVSLDQGPSPLRGFEAFTGSNIRGQAVSFSMFIEPCIFIAQSLSPAPNAPFILIEWVIVSPDFAGNGSIYIRPAVTVQPAQFTPFMIPIPDLKTLWDRAGDMMPVNTKSFARNPLGLITKMYSYRTEAEWIAAGRPF